MSEDQFKILAEFKVEYGHGPYSGEGWKITIKAPDKNHEDIIVFKSNLSEVRDILEGNLLRHMEWRY